LLHHRLGKPERLRARPGRPRDERGHARQGFELRSAPTAVSDFSDQRAIVDRYYPETQSQLRAVTGAVSVAMFDHTVRLGVPGHAEEGVRDPVRRVHNDQTFVSGPRRGSDPTMVSTGAALVSALARHHPARVEADALAPRGYHSPEHLNLLAEAMRRAFADRNTLLGDPAFVQVPLGPLLSAEYASERRRSITARATPSNEVGPGLPRPEGDHTTHIAVVDAEGAAVSLTTTLNDFFGSGVTVTGAGFLLNDEMDDFTTDPGAPNLFGLVQGVANAIAPGKRMLSSMAPTLLLDADGEVRAVAGARGGPRIITATWQVVSNVVDFGMNALEAVHAPRLHQQWQPDEIALEQGGFTPDQIAGLERRGHRLRFVPELASSPVILRDPETRQWTGAADPRRGGEAAGR
jgi:gamma-glutamyltranspeptidase/glutathione hydrolase